MRTLLTAACATALLAGCSSGSSKSPPPRAPGDRTIELAWTANHERAVNSTGGGYRVTLTGRPEVNLPYAGGALAPTSLTTTLHTGTYTLTVKAYGLDVATHTTTQTTPAAQLTVNVP